MSPRTALLTFACLISCALIFAACTPERQARTPPLNAFIGTFGDTGPGTASSDTTVTFSARHDELLMQPALWSGPMVLRRVAPDSFVVATHPRFGVRFEIDGGDAVSYARVHGISTGVRFVRLDESAPRPVQLLMRGEPREAARRYLALDADGADRFVHVARRLLRSVPTHAEDAVAFLAELNQRLPENAAIHAALGDAFLFVGRREDAVESWERAIELDPANDEASTALRRIGNVAQGRRGWELPYSLASLFEAPTPEEIDAVWQRWKERDLEPRDTRVVLRRPVNLDGVPAEARIIEHTVHGGRHLGVVIVPDGASAASLPVLVEAKGVSPSFFPLDVPGGLTSPFLLAESRGDVVYVAPGYRGERIIIGRDTLVSEGDRTDAWDGATDDAIALLRAAMEITPEADTSRVCVFGRSRGGAVALMTGIREPRVDCVVSWAAPTDWFSLMDLDGWTQAELVADGLRNRARPGETGGQFINYFLAPSIEGRRDLAETRMHLIAGSALYFGEKLPRSQVHWGLEDTIVPSVNGSAFVERYNGRRSAGDPECLDVHFHPNAGHDQDRQLAPMLSRRFLLDAYGMAEAAECRTVGR